MTDLMTTAMSQAEKRAETPSSPVIQSTKRVKMTTDIDMTNAENAQATNGVQIDEDLHSRQLAVYGKESMRRMASSNVLIVGLGGLGVEVAKNVILAGLKSVTLHDATPVEMRHLGSQFYLTEADIGKPRAEACRDSLQELNTAVSVSHSSEELSDSFLGQFDVVVATQTSLKESVRIDEICRKHGKAFIKADIRGVFASVFCDFGEQFEVTDVDGEQPHSGIVAGITPGATTLVTSVEDDRLEFESGDLVVFSEVEGMVELNSMGPVKVISAKPHSLEIEVDSTGFATYVKGGIVTQVKQPKTLSFKSLAESIDAPGEFLVSDFSKFDRPPVLHVGFRAVDDFVASQGRAPRPGDAEDSRAVLEIANRINDNNEAVNVDEKVIGHLSRTWSAELNPMAAAFGGVVGQEVVKAASGKFHPIFQWFYFDSIESLPEEPLSAEETMPEGGRYDDQIAVFGRSMQRKLEAANVFLVGAGALGCEFLKNMALMGVSCGPSGKLTVTDDDTIEKSNLSRQFLFRDWDIGNPKSSVAGAAAKKINPSLSLEALQNRVSPDTEEVFNDEFWTSKDLIVNALDNVNARLYVDSRCVYFGKPLLESGTLGTKCNTQNIIPGITENYGATRDPPEKSAPMCTLHSFPHNIQHCLTFARSEFEGLLEKTPADANAYLENPEKFVHDVRHSSDAAAKENLKGVVAALITDRCSTFDECIRWARLKFQSQFHDRIKQLTYTFPEDAKTSTGALFWSAPKRFPTALEFDAGDASHAAFIQAAAILKAQVHNIEVPGWAGDAQVMVEKAAAVEIEAFVPSDNVKIETDPKKTAETAAADDDASGLEAMVAELETVVGALPKDYRLTPIVFEKDDDTNFHMQFIAGFANMRARNYSIGEVDKLQAKLIAGRIIPAIATTTALATGLVCLEMYKVFNNAPLEKYRDSFANLALPLFAMAEPKPPVIVEFNDLKWSLWDRWVLEGDLTVQQVLDWFKDKGMDAYSISCGSSLLYNSLFPRHKERLSQSILEVAKTVAKLEVADWQTSFDIVVAVEDENEEDVDVPLVTIKFA